MELCILKKGKRVLQTALEALPEFNVLTLKLEKKIVINGRANSTLPNYLRCLAHLTLYYKCSPEHLDQHRINDYLFHCKTYIKPTEKRSMSFLNLIFINNSFLRK
jgi:hypothetical protein